MKILIIAKIESLLLCEALEYYAAFNLQGIAILRLRNLSVPKRRPVLFSALLAGIIRWAYFMPVLAVIFVSFPALAKTEFNPNTFAGIEFFGSSQLTRQEIEKMLALKPGASADSLERAVERLRMQLERRRLESIVDIVSSDSGLFVTVDVFDSGEDAVSSRRLKFPRHVNVSSDKPFMFLQLLHDRLDALSEQGRPAQTVVKGGVLHYSDEPAEQIVEDICRFAPTMRDELVSVTVSDPDPVRRRNALELLNWYGDSDESAVYVMEAMDDSDPFVRSEAVRYLLPRLKERADNFPFDRLIELVSKQLRRSSHQDRKSALYLLLSFLRQRPEFISTAKDLDEARIKDIAESTQLAVIQKPALELLDIFRKPPRSTLPFIH